MAGLHVPYYRSTINAVHSSALLCSQGELKYGWVSRGSDLRVNMGLRKTTLHPAQRHFRMALLKPYGTVFLLHSSRCFVVIHHSHKEILLFSNKLCQLLRLYSVGDKWIKYGRGALLE
jgi:hypothetical protein